MRQWELQTFMMLHINKFLRLSRFTEIQKFTKYLSHLPRKKNAQNVKLRNFPDTRDDTTTTYSLVLDKKGGPNSRGYGKFSENLINGGSK